MSTFKKGDRVECIAGYPDDTPKTGWTGVIEDAAPLSVTGFFNVKWRGHENIGDRNSLCLGTRLKLINEQPQQTMPTKEQIIEAAGTSEEAKNALKKLFPDVFPAEPHEFISNFVVADNVNNILSIGSGFAPFGLERKCLAVHRNFRVEQEEYNGRTILTFFKK